MASKAEDGTFGSSYEEGTAVGSVGWGSSVMDILEEVSFIIITKA